MNRRPTRVPTLLFALGLITCAVAIPLVMLGSANHAAALAAVDTAQVAAESSHVAAAASSTAASSYDRDSFDETELLYFGEDDRMGDGAPSAEDATDDSDLSAPQQRGRGQARGRGGRGGGGGGVRGVYRASVNPTWFANSTKFWYRNNLADNKTEYILVDAEKGARSPAFDHKKLAAALQTVAEQREINADRLPFTAIQDQPLLTFNDAATEVSFFYNGGQWTCKLGDTYECTRTGDAPAAAAAQQDEANQEEQTDPQQARRGGRGARGGGGQGGRGGRGGRGGGPVRSPNEQWTADIRGGNIFVRPAGNAAGEAVQLTTDGTEEIGYGQLSWSPDSKQLAAVRGGNIFLRPASKAGETVQLTTDGTAGIGYRNVQFSPDGKTIVAFRVEPGENLQVHLITSSPDGGGRATLETRPYELPGDRMTSYELNLLDLEAKKQTKPQVDKIDFGNPNIRWDEGGQTFTYQKNDRGHQRFRLIRVNKTTGEATNIIDEQSKTFVWTAHAQDWLGQGGTGQLVRWLEGDKEILWVSEKDGWRHLYLVDAKTGEAKQITRGEWVMRGVDRVDEEKRQIWFRASGRNRDQDPYLIHYYRINFDGTNLVALTAGHGNHSITYSPDEKYIIDSYNRVDLAPITELRRVSDGQLVCELEEADTTELKASDNYSPVEVFSAKGRDNETDIWGIIYRPRGFDPQKKYPVIESIYAGPHGSHVPKTFGSARQQDLADQGYIVVQIDGMGTANRSKKFHDVCWQNIKDAGFPDRIKWMQAAAAKYPYIDITRVGIFGTSAGGQNAMAALLFHPEFYDTAVANCGCHDNRMDKASWNEEWMGYPVGPQYAENSNIDNAWRLRGKLMLVLGELDHNVPPETTMRVCNALIQAGRDFDFYNVPNADHGAGAPGGYNNRRLRDFFAKNLQGIEPPNRNETPAEPPSGGRGGRRGRGALGAVQPAIENAAAERAAPYVEPEQEAAQQAQPGGDAQANTQAPAALPPLVLTGLESRATRTSRVAERYRADRNGLSRFYLAAEAPNTRKRMRQFYSDWVAALIALPTNSLSEREREEITTLKNEITDEFAKLEEQSRADGKLEPLLPFAGTIYQLVEERQLVKPMNPEAAAGRVDTIAGKVEEAKTALKPRLDSPETNNTGPNRLTSSDLTRAATRVSDLRQLLQRWHGFYDGYDPLFSWWLRAPFGDATKSLDAYATYLKEQSSKFADATAPEASPPQVNSPDPAAVASLATNAGPKGEVPDLMKLINAPTGYMELVVARYQQETGRGGGRGGRGGRGGGGRGGRGGGNEANQDNDAGAAQEGERGQGDRGQQAAEGNQDNTAGQGEGERRGRGRRGGRGRGAGRGPDQAQDQQAQGQDTNNAQGDADQGQPGEEGRGRGRRGGGGGGQGGRGGFGGGESREQQVARANRWLEGLKQLDFDHFSRADKVDYLLLKHMLDMQVSPPGGGGGRGGRGGGAAELMDDSGIPGRPVGREALMADLAREMVDYTPEQLIEIGNREMKVCREEMIKASREMGCGDDWMAAVEKVKNMHEPPGGQPQMIHDVAWEAIDYLNANNLITVPPIASEIWGMQMMSPQRQLVNPFFTGGASISVSYPTDTMSHDAKLQSMRGNNYPFARATAFHELIPGHNMQGFMSSRYNSHRRGLGGGTPFWGEGWALYWELLLYEKGFTKKPEDRVGALVWRSHRCARIVFSLSFHMGKMLPGQCVDYLMANVGFDKKNAEGEVRRSFAGGYGPLYQAAYLLGGLQLRQLHRDVVDTGKMTDRDFHDAIIEAGSMPIKMVRVLVTDTPVTAEKAPEWLFYGPINVPQASATGQQP